ncbi:MAG: integrase family protein [Methyloceanibacter sp.]
MTRAKRLSDLGVASLKPRAARYVTPDPELGGMYIRVQPSGAKSFVAVTRDPNGKQVWATIGPTSLLPIAEAREKARSIMLAIKAGQDTAGPETFGAVADNWFRRHVLAKNLISAVDISRYLDRHLYPAWRGRDFSTIRRGDVAKLLDAVDDASGPVAADFVLSLVRNISNWYAARHEDYQSPIVRGMRRTDAKARARARILDDDELRAVWNQAEANGVFGAFIRLALLTGQRREKIASMKWSDVTVDGEWQIQAQARQKGTAVALMLPAAAIDIIRAQPRYASNPYIFAGRENGHLSGFSKRKDQFDAKVKIEPWVFHDLRRTARSLMSRAGVRPDIAERVLGHSIQGVAGIYDRHSYSDEKADALRRLAALIETIINPPVGNVVQMVAAQ